MLHLITPVSEVCVSGGQGRDVGVCLKRPAGFHACPGQNLLLATLTDEVRLDQEHEHDLLDMLHVDLGRVREVEHGRRNPVGDRV